jgi:uncharacterized protein YggU (UPF0235/DUF167 family)
MAVMSRNPYRSEPNGLLLFLRVTPKASADHIEGVEHRDDGTAVLRVRVRAVPERGKANAAAIALVARALDWPRTGIALVAGETSRLKSLRLSGEPAELIRRLQQILG